MTTERLEMATHDEGAAGERAKPKRTKVSPARNAVAAVLLVSLSTVAYLEWNANRQSVAAIGKLNQALAKEEGELLSMEQVEKLIGRGPDGPGVDENGETKVNYTWKGVFRRYPLTTVYTKQSPPRLLRTE
jgi:hypothetical protein